MWIFVITFVLICLLIFSRHGIEIVFNAYETNFEFGVFIFMFGNFRVFEMKTINIEKFFVKEEKKKDLGFLKYINAKIDVNYSIATLRLTPAYAYLCASFCSLLEYVDSSTSMQINQNIQYQYQGINFAAKIKLSIFNAIYALVKYKFQKLT